MMGKRRQASDEEDVEKSTSDSEAQPKGRVQPKQSTTSKGKESSKPKTAKKPKFERTEDEPSLPQESRVEVRQNAEGEKYVDLGKKKRAAARTFKGQIFVDIREYYGTDGDEKPGKKGISLGKEQWEALKRCASTIDSLFAEQDKK